MDFIHIVLISHPGNGDTIFTKLAGIPEKVELEIVEAKRAIFFAFQQTFVFLFLGCRHQLNQILQILKSLRLKEKTIIFVYNNFIHTVTNFLINFFFQNTKTLKHLQTQIRKHSYQTKRGCHKTPFQHS